MVPADKVTVDLPNLMVSFLIDPPDTNENYEKVGEISKHWLDKNCDLDEKARKTLFKGDFAYFCAIAAPEAGPNKYRDFCDWTNWIFPFDDQFDIGELRDDPEGAKIVLDNLVDCMRGTAKPETMSVGAHHDIWIRFFNVSHSQDMFVFGGNANMTLESIGRSVHVAKSAALRSTDLIVGTSRKFFSAIADYSTSVYGQVRESGSTEFRNPKT